MTLTFHQWLEFSECGKLRYQHFNLEPQIGQGFESVRTKMGISPTKINKWFSNKLQQKDSSLPYTTLSITSPDESVQGRTKQKNREIVKKLKIVYCLTTPNLEQPLCLNHQRIKQTSYNFPNHPQLNFKPKVTVGGYNHK